MAPIQEGAGSGRAKDATVEGPYDELARVLAGLPRPRPVRMNRRGKIIAVVVFTAFLISLGIYAGTGKAMQQSPGGQAAGPSQIPAYAISIFFVVVFYLVMMNVAGRQKRLLAEGEIATARVTKRWSTRNGPAIHYEFTTPLGEQFSGNAPDGTRKLSEGMSVPVFYDPQSPKKQIALCGAFYEVVLPGEKQ